MGAVSPEWDLQTPGWTLRDRFATNPTNYNTSFGNTTTTSYNNSISQPLSQPSSSSSLSEDAFGFEHYNNALNINQELKRKSVQEWTESVPLPEDLQHVNASGAQPKGLKIFTGGNASAYSGSYPGSAQLYPPVNNETVQVREIAAVDKKRGTVESAAYRTLGDNGFSSSPTSHDSSPGSVFSQRTSASSLSSLSASSSRTQTSHPHLYSHLTHPRGNSNLSQQRRPHPRRTQVPASWTKPTLVRQEDRRRFLVDRLVECSTALVALIWPQSEPIKIVHDDSSKTQKALGLQGFIQETLRRSNTSYTTLQITLWYLTLLSAAKSHCGPSIVNSNDSSLPRSLRCGRRMFLAALILASKFIQDRNYTARAWSKITGLTTREISNNEFAFLNAIHWNLHLRDHDYSRWHRIVVYCTEAYMVGISAKQMWMEVLFYKHHGLGLEQIDELIGKRKSISPQQWSVKIPILSSPFAGQQQLDGPSASNGFNLTPCGRPDMGSNCPQRSAQVMNETDMNGCASNSSFTFTQGLATPTGTPPGMISFDGQNLPGSGRLLDSHCKNSGAAPMQPNSSWLPTPGSFSSASPSRWSNPQSTCPSGSVALHDIQNQQGHSPAWIEEQQNASNWINLLAEAAQMDDTTNSSVTARNVNSTVCLRDVQASTSSQESLKSLEDGIRHPEIAQRLSSSWGVSDIPAISRESSFDGKTTSYWRSDGMNAFAPINEPNSLTLSSNNSARYATPCLLGRSSTTSFSKTSTPTCMKRSASDCHNGQAPAARRIKRT